MSSDWQYVSIAFLLPSINFHFYHLSSIMIICYTTMSILATCLVIKNSHLLVNYTTNWDADFFIVEVDWFVKETCVFTLIGIKLNNNQLERSIRWHGKNNNAASIFSFVVSFCMFSRRLFVMGKICTFVCIVCIDTPIARARCHDHKVKFYVCKTC